ncbi:MAG: hypothetical protein ACPF8V_06250 [Luteibaculum sp.]
MLRFTVSPWQIVISLGAEKEVLKQGFAMQKTLSETNVFPQDKEVSPKILNQTVSLGIKPVIISVARVIGV